MTYKMSFWFEYGGHCLWSANDKSREKFGYAVDNRCLPVSHSLFEELNSMEREFRSYLNWEDPSGPSTWTTEHKADFCIRADKLYQKLVAELGVEFEIINEQNNLI